MHQGPCTAQSWSKQEVLQYLNIHTYRTGSIAYRVSEFLCCRTILVPPTTFPCEITPPSVFLLPVCIARLHLLAGEGVGGPKSDDSTETLVLYMQHSLCATLPSVAEDTIYIHCRNALNPGYTDRSRRINIGMLQG